MNGAQAALNTALTNTWIQNEILHPSSTYFLIMTIAFGYNTLKSLGNSKKNHIRKWPLYAQTARK
jgi:hypothetical protein